MKLRDNKGSITIFVLVGLLFMSAFLILSYGSNVSKSKTAKEMFNMISNIYSYKDGDENAYMRAYTALRKQNAQEMLSSNEGQEDTSTLELTKTFYGPISNYRIYGNSVQDTTTKGNPSPTNPVEIQSVGDLVTDTADANYGKYAIPLKVRGKNLFNGITINPSNGLDSALYREISMYYPEGTYTFSSSIPLFMQATDISGVGTGWSNVSKVTFTIQTAGTYYLRFRLNSRENWDTTTTNIQIEKGTVATEYEPYVEPQTFNIYLDEPLRKVGDYKDSIDFKTGTITRAVGVYKMDTTTLYFTNNGLANNNLYFSYISFKDSNIPKFVKGTRVPGFSNVLPSNLQGWKNWTQEQVHFGQVNSAFYLITQNEYTNLDDLYNYLSNNGTTDVEFVYALAETDETEIDIPELKSYEDYTTIEVLTQIAPSKIEVTYDGYTFEK